MAFCTLLNGAYSWASTQIRKVVWPVPSTRTIIQRSLIKTRHSDFQNPKATARGKRNNEAGALINKALIFPLIRAKSARCVRV